MLRIRVKEEGEEIECCQNKSIEVTRAEFENVPPSVNKPVM